MAYNDGGRSGYGDRRGGTVSQQSRSPQQSTASEPAKELPADYVDEAERVMRKLIDGRSKITTSKIRNILSMVSVIYNKELLSSNEKLSADSIASLQLLRIKLIYEAGRDAATKIFSEDAGLIGYIKGIGDSRKKFINFAHYMEALVAYHRFLGGREN